MDELETHATLDRRMLLKTAATGVGAAALTLASTAQRAEANTAAQVGELGLTKEKEKEKEKDKRPGDILIERPGSDFMLDVIKTLELEYIATNPGSSFRSLHESIVNHGGNSKPELREAMGAKARGRVEEHFSVRHQVDALVALWSGVLEQGRGSAHPNSSMS